MPLREEILNVEKDGIKTLLMNAMESLRVALSSLEEGTVQTVDPKETEILNPTVAFNELWLEYPRKLGMKEAKRHFNATVKDLQTYERIKKALKNYKEYTKTIDEQYIKHGSSWFNNWQDWENPIGSARVTANVSRGQEKKKCGICQKDFHEWQFRAHMDTHNA